jgi:hypothetical protein
MISRFAPLRMYATILISMHDLRGRCDLPKAHQPDRLRSGINTSYVVDRRVSFGCGTQPSKILRNSRPTGRPGTLWVSRCQAGKGYFGETPRGSSASPNPSEAV